MVTKEKIVALSELVEKDILTPEEFEDIIDLLKNRNDESKQTVSSKAIPENMIEKIKKGVCQYFNLTPEQLESNNRSSNVSRPRQIAFYICRKYTSCHVSEIGNTFGGRDFSTVIHASNKIEDEIKNDKTVEALVNEVVAVCGIKR